MLWHFNIAKISQNLHANMEGFAEPVTFMNKLIRNTKFQPFLASLHRRKISRSPKYVDDYNISKNMKLTHLKRV